MKVGDDVFKIGKISNYFGEPNSHGFVPPNDARSAKFRFYTVVATVR